MQSLLQDLRFACRVLTRNPGFTVVAVLTLALGIGANTAIFSLVSGVVLQPLPYPKADRLVTLQEFNPSFGVISVAWLNYVDWAEQNTTFEAIAAYRNGGKNLSSSQGPVRVQVAFVTANLFSVLQAKTPVIGRTFLPEEDRPGGNRVVILSHSLWQQWFGGDAGVVGQTVLLDGTSFTIVGIMPADFRFPGPTTDLWLSLGFYADQLTERGNHPEITAIGRLRPGVTTEQEDAELDAIAGRLAELYPETNADQSVYLTSYYRAYVGKAESMLLVLLGAVGFILLIACTNVASLMLVRSTARAKEFAIRTALGAGRGHLIRQVLSESVLLAVLAGAFGVLLALWGIDVLRGLLPGNFPRLEEVRVDGWVLAFALGTTLSTGLLFGLAPAWLT